MDFTFTDEQQQLRKSVREFAEGEIAPHVMEWDNEASHFPSEILPAQARGNGSDGRHFPGKNTAAPEAWLHRIRHGD